MKMYLDSANLNEISTYASYACVGGVTTNPSLLLKEKASRSEQILANHAIQNDRLFVQIVGATADAMYQDFLNVFTLSQKHQIQMVAKIPIDAVGLQVIDKIQQEYRGQEILGTAIYSIEQAMLAIISVCDTIAPYFNRIASHGGDPVRLIREIRRFIDQNQSPCQIVAASFKHKQQVLDAWLAGPIPALCRRQYSMISSMMLWPVKQSQSSMMMEQHWK